MRQKSCKTVRFYHLQVIKGQVGSPIKARLHFRQIYSDKLQNLVNICSFDSLRRNTEFGMNPD